MTFVRMTEEDFNEILFSLQTAADLISIKDKKITELERSKEEIASKYRALDAKYKEQSVDLSNAQDYAEGIEEELHNISLDRDRYKALFINYRDLFAFESESNKRLREKYGIEDDIRT